MPLTKSAIKAHRQSLTKRSRNKHFLALYREALKAFNKAIASGTKELGTLLSDLQRSVDTLVKKNILHKNTADRRKSSHARSVAKSGSTTTPTADKKVAPAKKAAAKAAPKAEKAAPSSAVAKKPAAKKAPAKAAK
jgi:small subunit ribosomal protein S20